MRGLWLTSRWRGLGRRGRACSATSLQFLVRSKRCPYVRLSLYPPCAGAATGKRVFSTLTNRSDKVLPYMKPNDEPTRAGGVRSRGLTTPVDADACNVDPQRKQRPSVVMFPLSRLFENNRAARAERQTPCPRSPLGPTCCLADAVGRC